MSPEEDRLIRIVFSSAMFVAAPYLRSYFSGFLYKIGYRDWRVKTGRK